MIPKETISLQRHDYSTFCSSTIPCTIDYKNDYFLGHVEIVINHLYGKQLADKTIVREVGSGGGGGGG